MNLFESKLISRTIMQLAGQTIGLYSAAQQVILHLKGKFTKVKFCH